MTVTKPEGVIFAPLFQKIKFMQMTGPEMTVKAAEELGLTADEFARIKKVLGRTPNFIELSIYSVMWSEHCSLKNSIKWLRTLPREGKRLLAGDSADENAGLVDIGEGLAVVFKIATRKTSLTGPKSEETDGPIGIHRDIFTKGARPVAALNLLCFGNPNLENTQNVVKDEVLHLNDYCRQLGVQAIAGKVFFHESFNRLQLANTLSLGIVKHGDTVSPVAEGPGNPVFIAGSDAVAPGTFSAAGLPEENQEDLMAVQPKATLQEKSLLEASLEAIKTGAVVGMQHTGIAGIICSAAGMCAKSGTGMVINLDKVPAQQPVKDAGEILFSGSRERVFVVGKAGEENTLLDVFKKWNVPCSQVGEVTDTGTIAFFYQDENVAEVPARSVAPGAGAPVYDRETNKPAYFSKITKYHLNQVKVPKDLKEAARQLFASPNLVANSRMYEHSGSLAGADNMNAHLPTGLAVLHIEGSKKTLALTIESNPAYVFADPYAGSVIAVAEASRKIVCTGAVPVAITNCLNFGNPYDPEVYFQFVQAIRGITDACKKFNTPVTGSNVSFYNQSETSEKAESAFPAPVIGMVGMIEEPGHFTTIDFKKEGDVIYMLGNSNNDLGSSEYLRAIHGIQFSPAPSFDLHEEFEIQQHVKNLIRQKIVRSAHGVSAGGLFTCLMESAILGGIGFNIETVDTFRKDCFLFGESQSRVVLTLPPEQEDNFQNYLINNNVSFTKLGEVFGNGVLIDEENFGSVESWKRVHDNTSGQIFEQ